MDGKLEVSIWSLLAKTESKPCNNLWGANLLLLHQQKGHEAKETGNICTQDSCLTVLA